MNSPSMYHIGETLRWRVDDELPDLSSSYEIAEVHEVQSKRLMSFLDSIRNEDPIFVSELFLTCVSVSLFDHDLVLEHSDLLLQFMAHVKHRDGGFRPCNKIERSWQDQPRIYSSYYSLLLLKLLNGLDSYMKNSSQWCQRTYDWLASQQSQQV